MKEKREVVLRDTFANPAPLGLFAFGMTTILLNLHNAGFIQLDSMILSMGIFYGGIAQVFAGVAEGKKNNTFGYTAFISFGFFWLSFAALLIMPKMGWGMEVSNSGLVAFLTIWGIFTSLLFVGTLRLSVALQLVFGSLAVLFFLLAIGDYLGDHRIKTLAGYEGIVCGFLAIYAGIAQVLNEIWGKEILPIGAVSKQKKAEPEQLPEPVAVSV